MTWSSEFILFVLHLFVTILDMCFFLFCFYECWCFLPSFEGNGWRKWERCMTVPEKWRPQTRRKEKELWQETTHFMTASIGLSWWEGWYHNNRDKSPSYCSNLLMIEVAAACLSDLGFFSNNLTLLPLSNLESIFNQIKHVLFIHFHPQFCFKSHCHLVLSLMFHIFCSQTFYVVMFTNVCFFFYFLDWCFYFSFH